MISLHSQTKKKSKNLSLGFGRQEVVVYFGYLTYSKVGKLLLKLRELKLKVMQ